MRVTSSFLLLVVRPGATSSVLAPSSDALVTSSFLLLLFSFPLGSFRLEFQAPPRSPIEKVQRMGRIGGRIMQNLIRPKAHLVPSLRKLHLNAAR